MFLSAVTANDMLWDRQIYDCDGAEVGKVDDIELTAPSDGGPPFVSALLCGPAALGPRIGGWIGAVWAAVGRRLRPHDDPGPVRVPMELVARFDRREVRLSVSSAELPADRARVWVREHIVKRIPGSRW